MTVSTISSPFGRRKKMVRRKFKRIRHNDTIKNPVGRNSTKNTAYVNKLDFISSHTFAVAQVPNGSKVADFGSGEGYIASYLQQQKNCIVNCYERRNCIVEDRRLKTHTLELDKLEEKERAISHEADCILLLDILEHLLQPDHFLRILRDIFSSAKPKVIITLPNIAFISVRMNLLMGKFNYAPRGIMDRTHLRFFTLGSFRELLEQQGYDIVELRGIPAPFPLVVPNKRCAIMLLYFNQLLIALFPGLFSYQIGCVARMKPVNASLRIANKRPLRKRKGHYK